MKRRPSLQELNLADDFLFAKVMENEEICRRLLEKILNLKIKKVRFAETQLTRDVAYDAKSVRLDVFLDDDENNAYTVEMQKLNEYNVPRRSRYYHSIVDVDQLLRKGMGYDELNRNFVIFFCLFDPFNCGLHRYTFEKTCNEKPELKLGDGIQTILLNTRGTAKDVDPEMSMLLRYIEESTDKVAKESGSELLALIHNQVQAIKTARGSEVSYMKFDELMRKEHAEGHEEGWEEGLAEGEEKGKQEGLIAGYIRACTQLNLPEQDILNQLMKQFGFDQQEAKLQYEQHCQNEK